MEKTYRMSQSMVQRHDSSIPYMALWQIYSDKEQTSEERNFIERIEAPILLEAVLAYRDLRHEREFFFAIFFTKIGKYILPN